MFHCKQFFLNCCCGSGGALGGEIGEIHTLKPVSPPYLGNNPKIHKK